MSDFYPFEFVGRGRETQLQWGRDFNYLIYRFKGQSADRVNPMLA